MSNSHFHRRYHSVDMEPMDDNSGTNDQTWISDSLTTMQLKRSEMNELIMDYLVHEGFKEAAERFREEAGIEPKNLQLNAAPGITGNGSNQITELDSNDNFKSNSSSTSNNKVTTKSGRESSKNNFNARLQADQGDWCDLRKIETCEMIDKRIEVRQFIEDGLILKAQAAINLYYPEFLDIHRTLYFKLQQQHLIELIRNQKISEVLTYVHDQLSIEELGNLNEMEKTLALLAYEYPENSPYASLLKRSHRFQLASEISDTILQETTGNVEPTKPRLVTLLKLLYWTQNELEKKKIRFPKMTDVIRGTIIEKD